MTYAIKDNLILWASEQELIHLTDPVNVAAIDDDVIADALASAV